MPIYKMKGSKDGKQKYRVRINYIDNEGKSKQIDRVAYGNAEATEIERLLRYQIKQIAPENKITVRKLYDKYIEAASGRLRETSLAKAKSNLEKHIIPSLGDTRVDRLRPAILQKWKNKMEEKESQTGLKLSLTTKQNVYTYFNALLNFAVKIDYINDNPLKKIGNFKSSSETKKEMEYYTPEEFQKYSAEALRMAQDDNSNRMYDFYVFFAIAFYTGLRKGEINALKWSDIEGEYLTVSRSIIQKLKGEDREIPPKNRSSCRTLQIPKPLISILEEQKERYRTLEAFQKILGCTAVQGLCVIHQLTK